jgi:type II secretory pathway pseudopilin PulG
MAFTLIEMLTTVAALVIVLGLMVSLARDVRSRSAERVTKDLLRALELAMSGYMQDNAGAVPAVLPLMPPEIGEGGSARIAESDLLPRAERNSREMMQALATWGRASRASLEGLPISADRHGQIVLDAWGGPVAFMPRQHPAIGMAGGDRPFFFSPGPDGRFLTLQDNLYSYESVR